MSTRNQNSGKRSSGPGVAQPLRAIAATSLNPTQLPSRAANASRFEHWSDLAFDAEALNWWMMFATALTLQVMLLKIMLLG